MGLVFKGSKESCSATSALRSGVPSFTSDSDIPNPNYLRGENMQRRYNGRWLLVPVILIALCFLQGAFAQETTAGLLGIVKDPSGATIAKANIEVTGTSLLGNRKVQTDDGGNFRIAALPPGTYILTVTAPGFRTFKEPGIDLTVGRMPTIEVKLEVGAVAETVEVSGAATMVDASQSKVSMAVQQEVLDNLPKGRSFQTLIPLAPGARAEALQSGSTSGSAASAGTGYQIDGASDGENVFLVDGVNVTQIQNGGVGKNYQMEFIEEVQVKTSSFEAEFGGALGGVINVVPKKGSNEWHGSLLTYLSSNAFNATPEYFMANKDQRTTVEPGYQAGGPLWKNKLWIFSSYIPSIDTVRRLTTFTAANPGPRWLTSTTTTHNAYNRLDYGVTNSLRLFASMNYGYNRQTGTLSGADSVIGSNYVNTSRTTDPNTLRADAGSVNPISIWTFRAHWTTTRKLVVSARYGYFFNNTAQRGTPVGTRYIYQATVNSSSMDLAGNPFPASSIKTSGYA